MPALSAVNQTATGGKALIVGTEDPAFGELAGLLKKRSVHLDFLPEKHLLYKLAQPGGLAGSTDLYFFNLLRPFRYDWRDMIRRLRLAATDAGVVVVFESPTRDTIEDAITAGADELLYRAELSSAALVRQRVGHLIPSETMAPEHDRERSGFVPPPSSANELRIVLDIAAPELRGSSGRLDATKVAERLDVPIARLAKVVGVSRQAVSQTPDSPGAQAALTPIGRALGALGRVFNRDDERKWLHTSHPHLAGRTPLEAIMSGQAEAVARMLETAQRTG